jgi:outer membrane receptor protein involved in Fe transport
LFYIGKQWALQKEWKDGTSIDKSIQLKGFADINLGAEYRYSKFLSFFANFNNIGNVRYYRWDRYPTQRFNALIGVTFVPF